VHVDEKWPSSTLQKGTLANAKLMQDAKLGVAMEVAMRGCAQLGTMASCGKKYPVTINFREDDLDVANWSIER
jgi:hypothetical protein